MHITGLYAALAALLVLALGVRISLARGRFKVGIGDGGHHELARYIRVHANALENLPLALLLLLILELDQTAPIWVHAFGIALLVGRVLHALGLSRSAGTSFERLVGMALTWLVLLAMAVLLLWRHLLAGQV